VELTIQAGLCPAETAVRRIGANRELTALGMQVATAGYVQLRLFVGVALLEGCVCPERMFGQAEKSLSKKAESSLMQ
jgi:hypothetical protein